MNEFMYLSESEKFSGGYIIIPNELYNLSPDIHGYKWFNCIK